MKRGGKAGVAGVAIFGCFAAIAFGAPVLIEDVELETSSPTTVWDPENFHMTPAYGFDCVGVNSDFYYSAVDDGEFDGVDDGFDDGLVLTVGSRYYHDNNDVGNLTAEELQTGPEKFGKLKVRRTDTAIPEGTTLRSLVAFKNLKRNRPLRKSVSWGSNMGSDSFTAVRDSSATPATTLTKTDRWVISSDSATDPTDPPVIHAFYGKGRPAEKVTEFQHNLAGPESADKECVRAQFKLKIPPRKTRYLLFFTDMTDAISNEDAIERAGKYDLKRPTGGILAGLTTRVKQRVLNWDLTG